MDVTPNISFMDDLPQNLPSLRESFRPERDRLSRELTRKAAPAQIVIAGRQALDRVAAHMADYPQLNPQIRKTALWLVEIVKTNTGLFDQGRDTQIHWREVPGDTSRRLWPNLLFFGGAAAMMIAAIIFKNGGALYAVGALTVVRALDPKFIEAAAQKLPFVKAKPLAIEDLRARYQIEAEIAADPQAFLSHIDDSLAAADQILARLSIPQSQSEWHEHPRLISALQNLFEAQIGGDSDYALKLIDHELASVLGAEGIEIIHYAKDKAELFDSLPSLGEGSVKMAAPAFVKDGRILRRGSIWVPE